VSARDLDPNEFLRMIGEAPLDDREPMSSGGQSAVGRAQSRGAPLGAPEE